MTLIAAKYIVCETLALGITAVRFARPDLRAQLDPIVGDDNELLLDIEGAAFKNLAPGETIILNFAMIERFPTTFFQLLLRLRQSVLAKQGRVVLCAFRPEIQPLFELMQGHKLFEITSTEEEAFYLAKST